MGLFRFAISAVLCCTPSVLVHCADNSSSLAPQSSAQPPSSSTTVIPLPEADRQYSSPTPVDTIVVDKNGNMTEAQYTYDPGQGGVVINNYDEVAGPDASVFFPAFEVGLMWWDGFWVDHDGYYWNGNNYVFVNDGHWHDHWNHYWHHDWRNKWHDFHRDHPNAGNGRGDHRGNFDHHHGMNRPAHPPHRGGEGPHGGGEHRGGGGHGGRR